MSGAAANPCSVSHSRLYRCLPVAQELSRARSVLHLELQVTHQAMSHSATQCAWCTSDTYYDLRALLPKCARERACGPRSQRARRRLQGQARDAKRPPPISHPPPQSHARG
eukprot:1185819-Alexandrium_andersonii.AAC.1